MDKPKFCIQCGNPLIELTVLPEYQSWMYGYKCNGSCGGYVIYTPREMGDQAESIEFVNKKEINKYVLWNEV